MNRGAAKQTTYQNPLDRRLFLSLVEEAVGRFGIEVIAYALMDNHYHLFLHSPDGQLSSTMQHIGRAYTQAYNSHHGRDGALFRGRFRSILVDSDDYFGRVTRYIELNPVAAGICTLEDLSTHPWSSFQYSAGKRRPPGWLSTRRVQSFFGSSQAYRETVRSELVDPELTSFYKAKPAQRTVLGSPGFVAQVAKEHPEFAEQLSTPASRVQPNQIEAALFELTGATPTELFAHSVPTHPARRAAILLVRSLTNERCDSLADRYGFSSGKSFLRAAKREQGAASSSEVTRLVQLVAERLDAEVSTGA